MKNTDRTFDWAVFDMDGTLLDSMPYWHHLGEEYLKSRGISPREDLNQRLLAMSMPESAQYFQTEYGLQLPAVQIMEEINRRIAAQYETRIPLKEGVKEYLTELAAQGVEMAVATSSSVCLVESAFSRLGIRDCFAQIISTDEMEQGKTGPAVYLEAIRRMGAQPAKTIIFEDAPYAVETVLQAGLRCIMVRDDSESRGQKRLENRVERTITTFSELIQEGRNK